MSSRHCTWGRPGEPALAGDSRFSSGSCQAASHNRVGDRVCVPLVWITGFADAALELNASALLDNVRGFMRRSVQMGDAAQSHLFTSRIRLGSHAAGGLGRLAPDVGPYSPPIVPRAEGLLEYIQVWQGAGSASSPILGKLMYVLRRFFGMQWNLAEIRRTTH